MSVMIKKYSALIALVCLLSIQMSGQFSFGAYAGITGSGLTGDSPKNFIYQSKIGFAVGGIVNYHVKPDVRISFQPGYTSSRPTGAYQDEETGEVRDSVFMTFDYVKLPFFLDVLSDNRKWHFLAGVDIQVATKQVVEVGSEEFDLSGELLSVNPVIFFGLGRRISLGKPILSIDLRFGQGVLNLSNVPNDETSYVPRIKTSVAELLVSIEFGSKD